MAVNKIKGLKIGTKVKIPNCQNFRWELLCNIGEITEVAYVGKDYVLMKATNSIKRNLERGAISRGYKCEETIEDFEQIRMHRGILELIQKGYLDIE